MRKANVRIHERLAGVFIEQTFQKKYLFEYLHDYDGPPVSLTMPVSEKTFVYETFPPFFDGVLPEGPQLEGLLKTEKIDRHDLFGQLVAVGSDLVGAVTVEEVHG